MMDFLEDLVEVVGRKHRKYRSEDHRQHVGYPSGNYQGTCPHCSTSLVPGARYCQCCSASLSGQSGFPKRKRGSGRSFAAKLLIIELVTIAMILTIFIALAAIYSVKNHTPIFEGFSKVGHDIFKGSLGDVTRTLLNREN